MFTKMFGPPPLANDYSYADRTKLRRSCRERRECLEGRDYSRPRSPRDATHILELHYAWWERRMRDNGKEDAGQMRDNEKEDARKRGGGADKQGGAHSRYQFFRCGKIGGGGGRINDGGYSDGTLRYILDLLQGRI